MIKFKKIISLLICVIAVVFVSACSPDKNNASSQSEFVGVAIFQNSIENTKWKAINKDKTLVNNIIETNDNKIIYSDDPAFLFYVYTQDSIGLETKDSSFLSNTTREKVLISDNKITFTFERLAEDTDILIYFVYKTTDGYYLKFIKSEDNISQDSETILLDIQHSNFTQVELNLKINLSINDKY